MLKDRIGKELLFFDGGMGTLLQEKGLKPGELPELWNIEQPEVIYNIHRDYLEAGSDLILANTFGANRCKFYSQSVSLEEVIQTALANARRAVRQVGGKKRYIGMDLGPTGRLLKPLGDLEFEEACQVFGEAAEIGEKAGADFIHIETMSDTYEVKAAVLGAKEHTKLPVFVTVVFDERGKMLTGGTVEAVTALLEGLRVDAIGMNCGLGPEQMIGLVKEFRKYCSLPLIVKPNAGLPKQKNGQVYYDVEPDIFAERMEEIIDLGASAVGGCCGTTPEHIRRMITLCEKKTALLPEEKTTTVVSSYSQAVAFSDVPLIIGERINPTGKKRLKEALRSHDLEYILREGIVQEEKGAHILDVNTGLPDINEKEVMTEVITELQSVTSVPLQIDTVDIPTMERAMRFYNGKPMINSVNGKKESMDAVFPLIQKYGGVVVALTLDENGIPDTAEGRADIAGKIICEAGKYGILPKDIVVDVLAMTVSSDPKSAKTTLKALRLVRERFGVRTILGVSNISFGLPNRPQLNAVFYTMALQQGLSAGIINPSSAAMMQSYDSYRALMNQDENFETYICRYGQQDSDVIQQHSAGNMSMNLKNAIEKGLKQEAALATKALLSRGEDALSVIHTYLIPALDEVGKGFESGTIFLPQLLMSAETAKISFEILKETMQNNGFSQKEREKIILATVKGDIHDIGKNIVKVLLENYGFDVLDLGKDVSPERIVETAMKEDICLVGLSALMTTTVSSMEETIRLLRKNKPDCRVMVGGAVLNQEYADMIGADFYGKDAMQSVYYAKEVFQK